LPITWIRERAHRQVAWVRRRLDPDRPQGLWLTSAVTITALCIWAFGMVTQDVVAHDGIAVIDPRLERFVVMHRTAAATGLMRSVTWLGSSVVLTPLVLLVGGFFIVRRADHRPFAMLAASLLGAVLLSDIVKPLVHRPRPPARFDISAHHVTGFSFPSGHATEALAVWGMLALLAAAKMPRRRYVPIVLSILVVALVGASRIYLGAHWLSDVLGGYALGGMWLGALVAGMLGRGERGAGKTGTPKVVERPG